MNTSLSLVQSTVRNYGLLTDVSKAVNLALGDQTSRTVSVRTAHGLKNTLNLDNLSDNNAEDVAHLMMAIAPALSYRKNELSKALGIALFILLFIFYFNGNRYI